MDKKSQYAGLSIRNPIKDEELVKQFNDFISKSEKNICPSCLGRVKSRYKVSYYKKCDECDKVFTD